MRCLYHFRTRGTGPEGVHIAGIAQALEALGHQVVFSSPTGVDPRATAGADPWKGTKRAGRWTKVARKAPPVVFELLECAYNAAALWRNARLVARENIDVIYERHAYFLCSTALLARALDLPLIVEVNELVGDARVRDEPTLRWIAERTDRITFDQASVIITVSPHLARRLVERGVDPDKVLVQPNAVMQKDVEQPCDGRAVRERYGLQNARVIGFVGWFVPWHRLDWLLEAFADLRQAYPDLKLMLVGSGPQRPELEERAETLGVAEHIVWTGAVEHTETREHIAAFDVAAIPHSNAYRSPIKLFEYMAQGRAVVAPRTEPIAMIVEDGTEGVLFDGDGAAPLRHALDRVLADESLRELLGRRAREAVLRKHTWIQNARATLGRLFGEEGTTSEPGGRQARRSNWRPLLAWAAGDGGGSLRRAMGRRRSAGRTANRGVSSAGPASSGAGTSVAAP